MLGADEGMMTMNCPYCHQELVEVDNPLRREVRHKRGQEADCPGPDGAGLPGLADPPGAGPRFVLNASMGLDGRLRLRPVATDEEADSLAQAVLRNDQEAVDRLVDAMDLENRREVRNTVSALSWFHDQGPAHHGPRTIVHQLSPISVEGDLATFLAPPHVLAGDLLVLHRGGRIMWRLADGSEGGSLVGVLDGEDGPRPPQGWSMASFTPVARLGRRPGTPEWTIGVVGEDGKLRDPHGIELAPIW